MQIILMDANSVCLSVCLVTIHNVGKPFCSFIGTISGYGFSLAVRYVAKYVHPAGFCVFIQSSPYHSAHTVLLEREGESR